jgi:putative photosynthetic complex assembly protein
MRNSNLSTHEEPIVATHVRVLRFIDQPDGSINVIDTSNEQFVQNFQGEQGFLRGTLRALVRERKLRGVNPSTERAFELIAHNGGRLTLRDPATGSTIALESFGPTNTAVFAGLMN